MSKSLVSISLIASDCCEDIGDSTESHFTHLQKKILEGFQELTWFTIPAVDDAKTAVFTPNDAGQYELPCDFVYETKVGLLINDCLITLYVNKDLRLNNATSTDTQIQTCIDGYLDGSISPDTYLPFYNIVRDGNNVGELYGMGCGFDSGQWFNIKDGILEVGNLINPDAEIVVEYKSNGIPSDGFKLVPTMCVPAIKDYAFARFYEHKNPNLSIQFQEKFKAHRYKLKRLYSHRSPEYLAWLWKSQDRPAHF